MLGITPVTRFPGQAVERVAAIRPYAMVDLDGLEPVHELGPGDACAVAGPLRRGFLEVPVVERVVFATQGLVALGEVGKLEVLAHDVVEVVIARPLDRRVVVGAKVLDALRPTDRLVAARHVVRHDVDDDLHAVAMRALDECIEFLETFRRVDREVRVDVVIVLDGVGRTGATLDHVGIVVADAVLRVVAHDGVMRHARVPDVRHAEFADAAQRLVGEVGELADAVFLDRAPGLVGRVPVAEQAGPDLVDDRFALGFVHLESRGRVIPCHIDAECAALQEAALYRFAIERDRITSSAPVVDDDCEITGFRHALVLAAGARQVDGQVVTVLVGLELEQFERAVLDARAALAVVLVHLAGRMRHGRVCVVVQGKLFTRVVARRLDLVRHRHEGAGADENRDGLERYRNLDGDATAVLVAAICPEVEPGAGRDDHADRFDAGVGNRGDMERVPPEVHVGEVDQLRNGLVFKKRRPHQRHAGRAVLVGQCVVIGQQAVAQVDEVAHDVARLFVVEDGLGRDVLLRMRAVDGLEYAVLQPADVHLLVELLAAGETTEIGVHVGEAEQPALQRELDLGLQSAPRTADVTGPGHEAVALRTRETRAHHDQRARVRVLLDLALVHHLGPLVAVGVVDLVTGRFDALVRQPVQGVARVHLGLAEVAPGRGHALLEQHFVGLPEPVGRVLVKHVDETGVAEVEIEAARFAGRRPGKHVLLYGVVPAFRGAQDERLGDRDRLDAVRGEIGDHVFGRRPGLAVPVEVAHVALDVRAEPVDVENDGIERDLLVFEALYDVARLLLGVITEARGEVAEGPARRQRLPAGRVRVVADQLGVGAARDDDVRRAAPDSLELQHVFLGVADVEPAARRIVEDDHVLVRRHDGRQAVIHLLRCGRVAVARLVVQRHALAAPVHAHDALAAAEDLLAILEREAETAQRVVGEIAVLLLDERLTVTEVGHAYRRLVDDGGDAVDLEGDRGVGRRHRGREFIVLRRQRERRQLLDAVLGVMHLECRIVDGRQPQGTLGRRNHQRVAEVLVRLVVAEVRPAGARCEYEQ